MINASIFIPQWWKGDFWFVLIAVIFVSGIAITIKESTDTLNLANYIKIEWNPWWFSVLGIVICIVTNIILVKLGRTSELEGAALNAVPFADIMQLMRYENGIIQIFISIGLVGLVSNVFSIEDSNNAFLGCLGNAAWAITISTFLGMLLTKPVAGIVNSYSLMSWHIGKVLLTILFIIILIVAINALTTQMIAIGLFTISWTIIDYDYIGQIGGNKFLDFIENSGAAVGPTIIVTIGVILIFGLLQLLSTAIFDK